MKVDDFERLYMAELEELRAVESQMVEDGHLKDAALIASLQRVRHYEIVVPRTLANRTRKHGHGDDAMVLSHVLDQNRQTDARLSAIADEIVKPAAS